MRICDRCGHHAGQHWSAQHPPVETTACRECLKYQLVSGPAEWRGFCCRSAATIAEDGEAALEVIRMQPAPTDEFDW